MINMTDTETDKVITWVKNRPNQQAQTLKDIMVIHGDQLGKPSGYNGAVKTDSTKQQIFSKT